MTPTQIVQTLTSPLALLLITAILGYLVRPWLLAHAASVQQTTAAITDSRLRAAAESIVRWLEQDPQQAQLPGLVQRTNGISALAQQMGIPLGDAGPLIDDAFNLLSATGRVVMAPTPVAVPPVTPDLHDLAAAVLAQIAAIPPAPEPLAPPPASVPGVVATFTHAPPLPGSEPLVP